MLTRKEHFFKKFHNTILKSGRCAFHLLAHYSSLNGRSEWLPDSLLLRISIFLENDRPPQVKEGDADWEGDGRVEVLDIFLNHYSGAFVE